MLDFINGLFTFFEQAANFIATVVTGVFNAITLVAGSTVFGTTVAGFMPYFLATCFYVFFFIFLIKFLVGR